MAKSLTKSNSKSVLNTSKSSKSVLASGFSKPSMGKGSCCNAKAGSKAGDINIVIPSKIKK